MLMSLKHARVLALSAAAATLLPVYAFAETARDAQFASLPPGLTSPVIVSAGYVTRPADYRFAPSRLGDQDGGLEAVGERRVAQIVVEARDPSASPLSDIGDAIVTLRFEIDPANLTQEQRAALETPRRADLASLFPVASSPAPRVSAGVSLAFDLNAQDEGQPSPGAG